MNESIINLPSGLSGARQDVIGTAKILGVREHDIATLVRGRLLKPLGNPTANAPKYFATCELLRLANDVAWLDRATRAISQHWKNKNAGRSSARFNQTSGSNSH